MPLKNVRLVVAPAGYGGYTSPDLTVIQAEIPGLDGYRWNNANHAWFKSLEKETQRMIARPPIVIPQHYMGRGLQTEATPPAGLGTIRTMLTGRV